MELAHEQARTLTGRLTPGNTLDPALLVQSFVEPQQIYEWPRTIFGPETKNGNVCCLLLVSLPLVRRRCLSDACRRHKHKLATNTNSTLPLLAPEGGCLVGWGPGRATTMQIMMIIACKTSVRLGIAVGLREWAHAAALLAAPSRRPSSSSSRLGQQY